MVRVYVFVFSLVSLVFFGTSCQRASTPDCFLSDTWPQLAACWDGDTCTVSFGNGWEQRVRLAGIDAPEIRGKRGAQPFAVAARDFLRSYIGQSVQIRPLGPDRYQRMLVEIVAEGRSLNLELLRRGLAEAYRGPNAQSPHGEKALLAAESEAKRAGLGIWSAVNYISPYLYRRQGD